MNNIDREAMSLARPRVSFLQSVELMFVDESITCSVPWSAHRMTSHAHDAHDYGTCESEGAGRYDRSAPNVNTDQHQMHTLPYPHVHSVERALHLLQRDSSIWLNVRSMRTEHRATLAPPNVAIDDVPITYDCGPPYATPR